MFSEADEVIRRLQHQKNVWRGIAIGLGAALLLILVLAGGAATFLLTQSRAQAMRAEAAMQDAHAAEQHARMQAEEAARRALERQKKAQR